RLASFVLCSGQFLYESNVVVSKTHSAPATTSDRLDDHRITNTLGYLKRFSFRSDWSITAWNGGYTSLFYSFLGHRFITHLADRARFGADKLDVAGFALLNK